MLSIFTSIIPTTQVMSKRPRLCIKLENILMDFFQLVITEDDINNDQTLKVTKSQLSQNTNELQNDNTSHVQLWIQHMRL